MEREEPTRTNCTGSVSGNHNEPNHRGKCSWCGYHLGRPRVNTSPDSRSSFYGLDEAIRRNFRDERRDAESVDGPDPESVYYETLPYWPY